MQLDGARTKLHIASRGGEWEGRADGSLKAATLLGFLFRVLRFRHANR